jgi:hypothetical protein
MLPASNGYGEYSSTEDYPDCATAREATRERERESPSKEMVVVRAINERQHTENRTYTHTHRDADTDTRTHARTHESCSTGRVIEIYTGVGTPNEEK